jgi:hypothetical protein
MRRTLLGRTALALALLAGLAPSAAKAHVGGRPSRVSFAAPYGVRDVADLTYTVKFADVDADLTSDETFFYVDASLPIPTRPSDTDPARTQIFGPVPMTDTANQLTWDTSQVPEGVYQLLVRVDDTSFSPPLVFYYHSTGTVAVLHGAGHAAGPAFAIYTPDVCDVADKDFVVGFEGYDARDPAGTVDLAYGNYGRPDDTLTPIATALPVGQKIFHWDVSALPELKYAVFGIYRTQNGTARACAPDMLTVSHVQGGLAPGCDGGGAPFDAGQVVDPKPDGGTAACATGTHLSGGQCVADKKGGCGCAAASAGTAVLGLVVLGLRRRR